MFDLAFVGSLVPDRPPFNEPPFSRSGNLFQGYLLKAFAEAGVRPSLVLSFRTLPAFPKSRRILSVGGALEDSGDVQIHLLGFPNITPLKQIALGVGAFFRLVVWSLRRAGRSRVIYSYNLTAPPGLFVWLAARLSGAKWAASICDVEVPGVTVPATLRFRLDEQLHRFLIPRLDARVVVSDAIAHDYAPGLTYLRVEGGVGDDLVAKTESLAYRSRLANSAFRMVAVGKLDETNGFDLILEAMSCIAGDVALDIA